MTGASAHFKARGALIRELMSGGLDAADAVARTVPAAELLGLLVPIDGLTEGYLAGRAVKGLEVIRNDFEPWRRQLLAVVAALLERWVGNDPGKWLKLAARAGSYRGSVTELIDSVLPPEPDPGDWWTGRAPRWPRGVDGSAVLLAMAPPGIAEAFLLDCQTNAASAGILTRMLDRGPLHPLFVEYAIEGPGTDAMSDALFRNPAYPVSLLRDEVRNNPTDLEILERSYVAPGADRALRIACLRSAEAAGGFRPPFAAWLRARGGDLVRREPLLGSTDPELVQWALRRINTKLKSPALRWAGYATLARWAGPEPVWALERERAGSLAGMAEPVRDSMAAGSVAPILAAAERWPVMVGPAGSATAFGAPLIEPWPYAALIAEHVTGEEHRVWTVENPWAARAAYARACGQRPRSGNLDAARA